MSHYVNLTLDTLGPQNVSVILNDGEKGTISDTVRYVLSCSDSDMTDYQMKIWGTERYPAENDAPWLSFVSSGAFLISRTEGPKTVYFRLRDDVYNESETVSATIVYKKDLPQIKDLFMSPVKLYLSDGVNTTYGGFGFSETIDAVEIKLVSDVNARHNDPSNISIPTSNGSAMWDDLTSELYDIDTLEHEIVISSAMNVGFYINAKDIASVSSDDGVKTVKFFVRSASSGLWSV